MPVSGPIRDALAEALAASLDGPLPERTPRRVQGAVRLPGKATAVLGVRRAGKTTFVHQMRRERLASGTARALLPYVNFEDERWLLALTRDRLPPEPPDDVTCESAYHWMLTSAIRPPAA